MFKKIIYSLILAVVINFSFVSFGLAASEGETCFINQQNQCNAGLKCDADTSQCVKDTTTPPAGNTGSPPAVPNGRGGDAGSGSASNGCDKEGDEFCPKNKFCYINGLCVPKPEAGIKEGSLRGAGSIFEVITIVLKWLLTLAGVAATVFIIIGGYQYITAAGNEEMSEKGKKTLVNAVIGLVIVVLAMTMITIITNTLSSSGPLG